MRAAELRQLAAESAALLRTLRATLPASDLVDEIRCPRCGRWVTPRRFDPLCHACRQCKTTLARPMHSTPRQRPATSTERAVVPAAWTRWDCCPSCGGDRIAETRRRIDGVVCTAWWCRDCGTRTLWAARPAGGGVR
jgi:hypothetical protein